MHKSSGRAYTTVGGTRTTPWYHLPTPLGVPNMASLTCVTDNVIAPNGEVYRPTVPCGSSPPGTYFPGWLYWGKFLLGIRG